MSAFLLVETPASILRDEYLKKKKEEKRIKNYGTTEEYDDIEIKDDGKIAEIKDQLDLFFTFIQQPIILRPVIFILLYMATPSYSDPLFYFYTNVLNFTPLVMGRLKLVYGLASIIGIFIYNKYLLNISFKKIIWVTTILSIIFNMFTIVVVERVNKILGIPDLVFCVFTDAITVALAEMNTMPLLVLACNLCPKNIEGTLYAFLMSITNLGFLLSNQFGAIMTSYLGITNSDFKNLSILIFIANLILLFPMPALYLVDDKLYNSQLIENKQEDRDKDKENGFSTTDNENISIYSSSSKTASLRKMKLDDLLVKRK